MSRDSEYKDVRWQKKRLEVLERCGWKCQFGGCTSADEQIHVHHIRYSDGPVWDTPAEDLTALCSSCHEKITKVKRRIGALLHLEENFYALWTFAEIAEKDDGFGDHELVCKLLEHFACARFYREDLNKKRQTEGAA